MATCLTPVEMEGLPADYPSPADTARAETHLAECESCRLEFQEKRVHDHLFKNLQRVYARPILNASSCSVSLHFFAGFRIRGTIVRGFHRPREELLLCAWCESVLCDSPSLTGTGLPGSMS